MTLNSYQPNWFKPLVIAIGSSLVSGCQLFQTDDDQAQASNLPEQNGTPTLSLTDISNDPYPGLPIQPKVAIPSEDISNTILQVFRDNTAFASDFNQSQVKAQRNWYIKHKIYINRVLDRAEPYLYHIMSETVRRGLPSELAFLPIVESAYDPFAYSHGRAAGLWQFIPGTAKGFGLKQTWWYEGRRDIVASTDAALTYLESLNKQFDGDWLLALASYNSGAGTVRRAMRKNKAQGKPTDFWSLDLPDETSAYVPKLIAISQIIKHPARYDVDLQDFPYEPYFAEINIEAQLDLALAAKMAGIEMDELYQLNPGFNRWATDPNGPHRLLVPVVQAEQMRLEIANLPPEKRVEWHRYTIQSGDSISTVAQKHKITSQLLRDINHLSSNNIRAGKTLLIPKASQPMTGYTLSADQRLKSKQNRPVQGKSKTLHQVSSGESFWTIGRKYKVNHKSLAKWNSMAPGDPLIVGRKLVVWTKNSVITNSTADHRLRKIRYRVRSGDSYAGIAERFNVSLRQLQNWNNANLSKYLQPGDMLVLHVDVANAP